MEQRPLVQEHREQQGEIGMLRQLLHTRVSAFAKCWGGVVWSWDGRTIWNDSGLGGGESEVHEGKAGLRDWGVQGLVGRDVSGESLCARRPHSVIPYRGEEVRLRVSAR